MTEVEHSGEVSQETDDMVIYLKLASHTLTSLLEKKNKD